MKIKQIINPLVRRVVAGEISQLKLGVKLTVAFDTQFVIDWVHDPDSTAWEWSLKWGSFEGQHPRITVTVPYPNVRVICDGYDTLAVREDGSWYACHAGDIPPNAIDTYYQLDRREDSAQQAIARGWAHGWR